MSTTDLDIDHWVSVFPIDEVRRKDRLDVDGHPITSPFHLAIVEQIRREVQLTCDLGRGVPTDVFVFGKGEPEERGVTKIGGLPYRPSGLPWPTARDGRRMTFVAQFRFVESRDIVGDLPGDILLVFAREELPIADDPDSFHFEWHDLGIDKLAMPEEVPKPAWVFATCYGLRHRTDDFPNAHPLPSDYRVPSSDYCAPFSDYRTPWQLAVLEGTKIGGEPPWIQPPVPMPGEFLCSLGSVGIMMDWPFPWTNVPEPFVLDVMNRVRPGKEESLSWGDAGVVSFFLTESGRLEWILESY